MDSITGRHAFSNEKRKEIKVVDRSRFHTYDRGGLRNTSNVLDYETGSASQPLLHIYAGSKSQPTYSGLTSISIFNFIEIIDRRR